MNRISEAIVFLPNPLFMPRKSCADRVEIM